MLTATILFFRVWLLDLICVMCVCADWSCGILLSFVLLGGSADLDFICGLL